MVVEYENNQHNVWYRCTPIHIQFVQSHGWHADPTKLKEIFAKDIPLCIQFNIKITKALTLL
jgi:hypothetical protein